MELPQDVDPDELERLGVSVRTVENVESDVLLQLRHAAYTTAAEAKAKVHKELKETEENIQYIEQNILETRLRSAQNGRNKKNNGPGSTSIEPPNSADRGCTHSGKKMDTAELQRLKTRMSFLQRKLESCDADIEEAKDLLQQEIHVQGIGQDHLNAANQLHGSTIPSFPSSNGLTIAQSSSLEQHQQKHRQCHVFSLASDTPRDGETRDDFLIRTGKLMPFEKEGERVVRKTKKRKKLEQKPAQSRSQIQAHNCFLISDPPISSVNLDIDSSADPKESSKSSSASEDEAKSKRKFRKLRKTRSDENSISNVDSDYRPEQDDDEQSDKAPPCSSDVDADTLSFILKKNQVKNKKTVRGGKNKKAIQANPRESDPSEESDEEEIEFSDGLKMPASLYDRLYEYQQTCLLWLWALHEQVCGGIIGDEMGLGKTIQIISFLVALLYSEKLEGPVLIVAPATLLMQWKAEFKKWAKRFHVVILHRTIEAASENFEDEEDAERKLKKNLARIGDSPRMVAITSYEYLRRNAKLMTNKSWEYVILDEGHKIRNPDADITLVCKQFTTPRRIILSGSPLQNRLKELWSLFDFIFPGKLGTLPVFEQQFSVPISQGGYLSASPRQVHIAFKCATTLKKLISPYLLRRLKKDVALQLPQKQEHVLFCKLTEFQIKLYRDYLKSSDVRHVYEGKMNLLAVITVLRKICNHVDLLNLNSDDSNLIHGDTSRSGKLAVLQQILKTWKKEGSRVLIFSQTTAMLDIIESFVVMEKYNYLRMDGKTALTRRSGMIDEYNNNDEIFLFLLTTKVGGLGLNLTGANRIVIFDPDWNPSTDLQARERAWRIGQKREVNIYRLITSGTIEEKIYHRQIFKTLLSEKVLKDARQRRVFNPTYLKDLLTLDFSEKDIKTKRTYTTDLFYDVEEESDKEEDEKKSDDGEKEEIQSDAEKADNNLMGSSGHRNLDKNNEDSRPKQDGALLKKLFDSMDGVHSSINHDAILQSTGEGHDMELIEYEANRVAEEAEEVLKRSYEERNRVGVFVPTWTGRSGAAGESSTPRPRFGGSKSSATLEQMRNAHRGSVIVNRGNVTNDKDNIVPQTLINQLVLFMQNNNCKAATSELIHAFANKFEASKEGIAIFKALLKKIATKSREKSEDGEIIWQLKEEHSSTLLGR